LQPGWPGANSRAARRSRPRLYSEACARLDGTDSEPDTTTGSADELGEDTGSVDEPATGSFTSTRSSTNEVLPEKVGYAAGASLPTFSWWI
jgi:hypothetical protein